MNRDLLSNEASHNFDIEDDEKGLLPKYQDTAQARNKSVKFTKNIRELRANAEGLPRLSIES